MLPRNVEELREKYKKIGEGLFGEVFLDPESREVIKIMTEKDEKKAWLSPQRAARILCAVNQDDQFARAGELGDATPVLITKYIDGKSVTADAALFFVLQRGRVLLDYRSDGNVREDEAGKKWLIDADLSVNYPTPLSPASKKLSANQDYGKIFRNIKKRIRKVDVPVAESKEASISKAPNR